MSSSIVIIADLVDSKRLAASPGGRQSIAKVREQLRLQLAGELLRYSAILGLSLSEHESRGDNLEFRLHSPSLSHLAEAAICSIAKTLAVPGLGGRFRFSAFTVDAGVSYHPRYGAFEGLFKEEVNRNSHIAIDRTLTSFIGEKLAEWMLAIGPRSVPLTLVGEPILGIWVDVFATTDQVAALPSPPEPELAPVGIEHLADKSAQSPPSAPPRAVSGHLASEPRKGLALLRQNRIVRSKIFEMLENSRSTQTFMSYYEGTLGSLCKTLSLEFRDGFVGQLDTGSVAQTLTSLAAEHGYPVDVVGVLPINLAATVLSVTDSTEQVVRMSTEGFVIQRPRNTWEQDHADGISVSCEPVGLEVPVDSINVTFRSRRDPLTDRGLVWVRPGSPARMHFVLRAGESGTTLVEILRTAEAAVRSVVVEPLLGIQGTSSDST